MQMTLRALALSALTLPVLAGETWHADYDEAVKVAQDSGKYLLVDFTGSDWCGWCIRLHDEVFSHEEFDAGVKDKFVLVSLDFPNTEEVKAKVPNPKRNQELLERYGIEGFPTVLLMTVDGEVFGRTGYREGGPEAYVEHLNKLVETGLADLKAVKKALEEYAAAEGEARSAKLDALLDLLARQDPDSAFIDKLLGPAHDALASGTDAQKNKAMSALIEVGAVDSQVLAMARKADPKNEAGKWFEALSAYLGTISDIEGVQKALLEMDAFVDAGATVPETDAPQFYFMAAYWYDQFGSPLAEDADDAARKAHDEADALRAKRYAKLAKPLWDDPQRLEILDGILGN